MKTTIITIIIIALTSCNTMKQLARKQAASLSMVLASKELLDSAGIAWEKNHPCVNDTSKDEYDTMLIKADSIYWTIGPEEFYTDTSVFSFPVKTRIIKSKPDTLKITKTQYVEDTRRVDLYLKLYNVAVDSLNYYRNAFNAIKNSEKELGYSWSLAAKATIREWWFWLIILAGILVFIFRKRIPF